EKERKRGGLLLPLVLLGGAVIAGVVIFFVSSGGSDESGKRLTRGSVGGSDRLGYTNSDTRAPTQPQIKPDTTAEVPDETVPDKNSGKTIRPKNWNPIKRNGGKNPVNIITKKNPRDTGEVDLNGPTSVGPTGPLDGDDLSRAYRKNQIALKMCYERSLKRDPLLKVPKTLVNVKVGLNGKVSSVRIPSLAGTDMGQCLVSRIRRWKFRPTTEIFNGQFLVVFDK
ncbi:MAG: AgmX/PglI C-terminal domain-containing protein, partial [Kofleriaceae bacterium]|nr:AgmX/PglI C-terminal domain-containing protein [Kofleriaceae bacterium]